MCATAAKNWILTKASNTNFPHVILQLCCDTYACVVCQWELRMWHSLMINQLANHHGLTAVTTLFLWDLSGIHMFSNQVSASGWLKLNFADIWHSSVGHIICQKFEKLIWKKPSDLHVNVIKMLSMTVLKIWYRPTCFWAGAMTRHFIWSYTWTTL